MFSGRMPHEVGVTENNVPIAEEFRQQELGHVLSAAGYECVYAGKWHIPEISIPDGHGFRELCPFDDVELAGRCREFLSAPRDRRFFLVASFDNPHNICEWRRETPLPWGPIGRPPRVEDCPPLPPNYAVPPFEPGIIREVVRRNPKAYAQADYSDEQWRRYRWAYNRLVQKVDQSIGEILEALRDNGLEDDTLVLFSSDHGDHQGCHHLSQKSILYEEAARVPFIARTKGVAKPGHVDTTHLVSNGLDLYATICDFAGVEPPEALGGRSLRSLLSGEAPGDWRDHLVLETRFPSVDCDGRAVITDRHKYVAYGWGTYREQLFDLGTDPGEMSNLAICSHYGHILERHRRLLREWCETTNDTFGGGHYAHRDVPYVVPGDEYYRADEE